jgi:Ca-activated chloride channel family protein
MRPQHLRSVLLAFLVLTLARLSLADGLIVVHNPPSVPPGHFPFAPLEVGYHRVTVDIKDQVAVTKVDQEFYNPNDQRLEGTYLFPLPEGAHVDKFSMDIGGKQTDAELLDADNARKIYEDIVRKYRDPALLEYAGRGAFKARVFPIEPHGKKQIRLEYTQLLKPDSGVTEYTYSLNTEKFSARPLKDVSVKVTLAGTQPLKSIYCPTHTVDVKRDGDRSATVTYTDRDVRPDTDFKLIFSQEKDPVGIHLLTYRSSPDDGYFLLLASPGMETPAGRVQPKDIAFVLDTSGSMAGPKIEQAKKALLFCVNNLNAEDRFEVVRFSTESESLFGSLQPADAQNVKRATDFVKDLKGNGGTAIADALAKARDLGQKRATDKERPYVVVFLTDGQPTVGERDEDKLLATVRGKDASDFSGKIFSFGIGHDVNTHLLDRLADGTQAFSQYVLPEEDIEVKVSSFYSKIKEPVLANLSLAFTGGAAGSDVKVTQLYPAALPDLFRGEVLTVFGRYSGHGPAAATITGTLDGQKRTFTSDVTFADQDRSQAFIPRLWATRRVGWLLDEIRMHGENPELKQEVIRLAREHGIVTPYTAYLILEDEDRRNVPVAARTMRELQADAPRLQEAKDVYDSARADSGVTERAGARAVQNAQAAQSLKAGSSLDQSVQGYALSKQSAASAAPAGTVTATAGGATGYRFAQNYAQQAKVLNGRAFYQNGTTWTDATVQTEMAKKPNLRQQQVQFNSDEYFALLRKHPEAAAWLSLGNEVDVVLDDTIYNIR